MLLPKNFIEVYPDDWGMIQKNHNKHLRKSKDGKNIPIPEPRQYLKNALNIYVKKIKIK
ncbi:hypothetical protein [Riemerella anatipestifer]|uniref:hypothetical protein n=1 Tax=Riemerella anatipestifer TaxID=34085 RepID=UPI001375209C|nr:hypothetical protein [Riemerella anatipestifer]